MFIMKSIILKIGLSVLIVCTLCCCSSSKRNLVYFDNIPDEPSGILGTSNFDIRLVPMDELFITVNSTNPEATVDYNLPLSNPAKSSSLDNLTSTPTQQTFIVDREGNINFPVLGKIHVAGMTTDQLTEYLTKQISENVYDPIVRVQLINFKVNVLGEVKEPAVIEVKTERFSILDALASVGDATEYANRKHVVVIREIDGVKHYQRLNLQDATIVESPYFYLRQNDVVYVEPNNIKEANSKYNQNNAYKLSVVSALVSGISVITSLIIALVINKN